MRRFERYWAWLTAIGAQILIVANVIDHDWFGVVIGVLALPVGLWWVYDNRNSERTAAEQEQLAAEWTDAKVQDVIAGHHDQVSAVKAMRAADPRLGLVTATRLVRRARAPQETIHDPNAQRGGSNSRPDADRR
ncbi:hypothetical protein [Mycobacteroides abscessus]|uniref:hypothetical protein n=1 Tax=Mycobacteroides abscessus TaxID=36809 RepID=UPI00092B10E9|nr:hypothetical protein [Mycobacteroides abscessus]MBN7332930.1 hypothetical protein [Mycobacteroides abscessus subsp. abscessus]SHP43555.1 Uncharacterised protein [Mycobacteroides abscessus subsp. abscessus]SIE77398.1 Uncharacterised protein [Mycobacteroides abscessus subsp. abscessus]SIF53802.1 Uncharacterised protein [Mycobacteroides abscessus subsp. abscessus]SIG68179.1 Uncharacterised protein [Mycobacteroides abscessus subsp. abscessus]